ncbi:Zinc finger putative Transcription Factor family [Ditylenchus destructor]|nr:Zinc finger putative Transcription Factor family [Ditylenchus destructor]
MCAKPIRMETEDELEAHIAADHFNCLPYWCDCCEYTRLPTEYTLKNHYEKVHGLTEYNIQYRHTPEIFRKRREIKEALLDALEKKKTNRHSSVSDSEQKGQSPFLPPVDTAAANIHALNGDDKMSTSAEKSSSVLGNGWATPTNNKESYLRSYFDDAEGDQPSSSTAILNRCNQLIASANSREQESQANRNTAIEQFCASARQLKQECLSSSFPTFQDLFPDDSSDSRNASFVSMKDDFGMDTSPNSALGALIPRAPRLGIKRGVFQKGVAYRCLQCNACVTGPCIILHINLKHLRIPCYCCKACDKKSFHTSSSTIMQHVRQTHNGGMEMVENNYKECSREVRKARAQFFEIYRT